MTKSKSEMGQPKCSPFGGRIAWLFDGDHLNHPFILIAVESLLGAGAQLLLVDGSAARATRQYEHLSAAPADTPVPIIDLRRAVRAVRDFRPEVVIATKPRALMAGWLAGGFRRTRLVYYPFELYRDQNSPLPRTDYLGEGFFVRFGIDALITQNAGRAAIYAAEYKPRKAPVVVHNYKPRRFVSPNNLLRRAAGLGPEHRIVLYQGLLHHGRMLDTLVRAAAHLDSSDRIVLMGPVKKWWKTTGSKLLQDPVIGSRVIVLPPVTFEEVASYCADADVGVIVYERTTRNNIFCEPGKLCDYVHAGVPVVAPSLPTITPIVKGLGIGELFEEQSPEAVADAIRAVLSRNRATWQPTIAAAAEKLCWETQEPIFLEAVFGTTVDVRARLDQAA